MPSSVQLGAGQLPIGRSFSVAVTGFSDARLHRAVERFVAGLSRETGLPLVCADRACPVLVKTGQPTLEIHADHDSDKVQNPGEDESYELTVAESGARLTAANSLGILHGLQTFLQLVAPTPQGFAAPVVTIRDQPRFPWRGLLIDVGRHFIPMDVLKRNVDAMAAVKMNVLHLHLSDNEGFRMESKRFPRLQEMGANGLYYTQAEMRDFIFYARGRGVRVLPEFEMPGHSRSWFVGYPELASMPGPYKVEPGGTDPVMDPTQDRTYKVLDKFIDEMARLFPDPYFHIGGDEVNFQQWDSNPHIQEFIHSHGMKNDQDLQAYFNQRLQKILSKHHKIMIGWDEVLHPDLPKDVVVQSWRGPSALAETARQGHRGILSFGYYLDLMWPAARHYAVDPMADAAALNGDEKSRILGGEACMWGEWVTAENIDAHIWPRNAAIAERLWSPAAVRDVTSMYSRLEHFDQRLQRLGLTDTTEPPVMLQRMTEAEDISPLLTLAAVVEPVKDYARMNNVKGPWDFNAPLNRMVDAVSPESELGRHFSNLVQAYLQSGGKDQNAGAKIRTLLASWRDNDSKLRPLLRQSFLLAEITPLSADLSSIATAGLTALDYLDKGTPAPPSWKAQQLGLIQAAEQPRADLLLVVAAPVRELVEAAGRAAGGP